MSTHEDDPVVPRKPPPEPFEPSYRGDPFHDATPPQPSEPSAEPAGDEGDRDPPEHDRAR